MFQRRQRIRGFAGLRDDHDERRGVGNAVAVTVFAGDLDRARNARKRLDPLFRNERGVIARPAGKHQHIPGAGEQRFGIPAE